MAIKIVLFLWCEIELWSFFQICPWTIRKSWRVGVKLALKKNRGNGENALTKKGKWGDLVHANWIGLWPSPIPTSISSIVNKGEANATAQNWVSNGNNSMPNRQVQVTYWGIFTFGRINWAFWSSPIHNTFTSPVCLNRASYLSSESISLVSIEL